MRLSRDKIQRMFDAKGGSSSGGGGGSDIAGGVTQAWVNQNYVSIEFFRKVFKVWAAGETSSDPDVEIMPNDIATTVKNIQAQAGLWTEAFLSALGQGSGGGTGGATTLDQLDDVVITSPTNGQALIYNATTQMWVNGTIQSGTDMATVWSALAAATNEQINASHLSGVLADYVTTTSLQTILGDYLTQTSADQRYITIAYFDRLFRAYNGSTLVSHNDTTSTIDNIKAMFGFWTDMYLSALGRNSAATGLGIDNLTDVTINTPTDGQVLQYNANSAKWENATIQTVVALSGLTDVLLTNPAANQVLVYDGTQWVNSSIKTINGYSIFGTGDIPASGGGTGNYLPLAGGTMTGTITCNMNNPAMVGYKNSKKVFELGSGTSLSRQKGCIALYEDDVVYIELFADPNSVSYINSGRLGIGTNSPLYRLQVNGDIALQTSSNGKIGVPYDSTDTTMYNYIKLSAASGNEYYGGGWTNGNVPVHIFKTKNTDYAITILNNGNVGIGSNSPSFKLDCDGAARIGGSTGIIISGAPDGALSRDCIERAIQNRGLFLQYNNTGSLSLCCGGGNVGVGVENPSYKLHVAGTIYATGAITALSDARKKDITGEVGVTVEQIAHAPAVQFLWKDKERRKDGQQVGTLAQYWQTVLPEVVSDKGGELSMQYGVAALVSAITIARKVLDHEQRIRLLEKENEELKKQLNAA